MLYKALIVAVIFQFRTFFSLPSPPHPLVVIVANCLCPMTGYFSSVHCSFMVYLWVPHLKSKFQGGWYFCICILSFVIWQVQCSVVWACLFLKMKLTGNFSLLFKYFLSLSLSLQSLLCIYVRWEVFFWFFFWMCAIKLMSEAAKHFVIIILFYCHFMVARL